MSSTPREVVVLDCSQVETPAQFWDAYVDLLSEEQSASFGRNLDALWNALAAAGPGWPGAVWIEVHNVERLVAHGGEALVAGLEKIQRDLEQRGAKARLALVRRGESPRGRLYQHAKLRSRELMGAPVERALRWRHHRPDSCEVLWLKPRGRCWQRFFLDLGWSCWEEWSDETIEEELDELRDELVAVGELVDQTIVMVYFEIPMERSCEIRFELQSGESVRMYRDDPEDYDSDTLLEVRPSK